MQPCCHRFTSAATCCMPSISWRNITGPAFSYLVDPAKAGDTADSHTVSYGSSLFATLRLEQDRQAREPSQEATTPSYLLGGDRQPQLRESSEQRGEGHLPFDPR